MELSLRLSGIFPKCKVCVKTLLSNKLRVRFSLTNWGQWRRKCSVDSRSTAQLHSAFDVYWKLCLSLHSLKWLKSSLSLEIRQISLGLWQLQTEFENGRINLRKLVLKIEQLSCFLRQRFKLCDSIMVNAKKEFLKKLCYVFRRGRFYLYRAEYNECLTGIKLIRYLGLPFSKTL